MRANWSSRRVLVIVVVDGMSALMTDSNDDNDICIVNVPLQQRLQPQTWKHLNRSSILPAVEN